MRHNIYSDFDDVSLRPMSIDDSEKYRVMRNECRDSFFSDIFISAEDQKNWYKKYLSQSEDYMFAIYVRDVFYGACALYDFTDKGSCEFGRIVISRKYAGGVRL